MRRFILWLWFAAAVAVAALVLWRTGSYRSAVRGRSTVGVGARSAEAPVPGRELNAIRMDSVACEPADTLPVRHAVDTLPTCGRERPVSSGRDDASSHSVK